MENDPLSTSRVSAAAPLRVLLVEDNPADARLLQEHLAEVPGLPTELEVATSLAEAREKLRGTWLDVCLLDLGLPDSFGVRTVESVAASSPDLPVIVLTGLDDEATALEALRAGAQDYLSKADLDGAKLAHSLRYAVERMRAFQRAQDAIRTRDRVLGIVAHDLRNPLGTISMAVTLLLHHELTPDQAVRQLQIIERSAGRMDRLIQDLLDVARLENERLALDLAYEDPGALMREAAELNAGLASARGLRIEIAAGATRLPVLADRGRIIQVLANLIGNAIKFAGPGGCILLRVERDGEYVRLSVEDEGPGIRPEEVEHLFEPFWQGKQRSGGAGLGLAIARGIVEAHGGRIWPRSELGVGTTIAFTLPLAPERRTIVDTGSTSIHDVGYWQPLEARTTGSQRPKIRGETE